MYNILLRKLIHTITLSEDGAEGIGRATGLSIENLNSIWMSSIGRQGNFVIDSTGKPLQWIDYEWEDDQIPDYTAARNNPYGHNIFDEDAVYIPQRLAVVGFHSRADGYKPIAKLDRETKKMQLLNFVYPREYYESQLPRYFTFESIHNKLIFGLVGSHDIHLVDKKTGEFEVKTVRSKFITEDIKSKAGLSGYEEIMMYNASEPTYPAIIPDPFRKLIYRIARLPPKDPEVAKKKIRSVTLDSRSI